MSLHLVAELKRKNGFPIDINYGLELGRRLGDEFGVSYVVKANGRGFYLVIDEVGNFGTKANAMRIKGVTERIKSDTSENGYSSSVRIEQSVFSDPVLHDVATYKKERNGLDALINRNEISQPEYQSRIAELRKRHGVYPASMISVP